MKLLENYTIEWNWWGVAGTLLLVSLSLYLIEVSSRWGVDTKDSQTLIDLFSLTKKNNQILEKTLISNQEILKIIKNI